MIYPTYDNELKQLAAGHKFLAGCDEAGIGPLAGPVVAAAVVLDPHAVSGRRTKSKWWHRLRDSKTVSPKERESLAEFIREYSLSFAVGIVGVGDIDRLNIYYAAMEAMRRAVSKLHVQPTLIFVDGNHAIKNLDSAEQVPVIGGDQKILSIAAASILAKVRRDQLMMALHEKYPAYGFDRNKGYPTKFHREAIQLHGVSPVHRRSFGRVKEYLDSKFVSQPNLLS